MPQVTSMWYSTLVMTPPAKGIRFTYEDLVSGVNERIFARARALCKTDKVTDFRLTYRGDLTALVHGTERYSVLVSRTAFDHGSCTCYMGEEGELCKHMIAVALIGLQKEGTLDPSYAPEKTFADDDPQKRVGRGIRKVVSYDGPSRIWWSYQRKLDTAAYLIRQGTDQLEPSLLHAKFIWKAILTLSDKLATGGVDDSNGTIGGAVDHLVSALAHMAHTDPKIMAYAMTCTEDTGFGFEDDLARLLINPPANKPQ